jgi:hypothetical protein
LAEKLLSRLAWIGISSLIGAIISSLYNYTLSLIHTMPFPSLPIIIPIGLAIGGFSLIVYDKIEQRKKRESHRINQENSIVSRIERKQKQKEIQAKQKEIEQLDKGESSDPQRQKENEDRFTPSNIK